jgi:hypothetical protein
VVTSKTVRGELKASDLKLLMDVVQAAIGLYNALETDVRDLPPEFGELGETLRALGVGEA